MEVYGSSGQHGNCVTCTQTTRRHYIQGGPTKYATQQFLSYRT